MFYLIKKYEGVEAEESNQFEKLKNAIIEAKTCEAKYFELHSVIWENFHRAGEKRDNGYIDWVSISH